MLFGMIHKLYSIGGYTHSWSVSPGHPRTKYYVGISQHQSAILITPLLILNQYSSLSTMNWQSRFIISICANSLASSSTMDHNWQLLTPWEGKFPHGFPSVGLVQPWAAPGPLRPAATVATDSTVWNFCRINLRRASSLSGACHEEWQ